MYLDRTYRPRRRRGNRPLWPFLLLIFIGLALAIQRPAWITNRSVQPTPIPTRGASSLLAEADALIESGEYGAAIDLYEQMVRLEPASSAGHVALAKLYLVLQELDRAGEQAGLAVELTPEDAGALTIWARVLDWRGDYEEALNTALDALEISPSNAETLAVLGEIYTDVGNWDVAQDYLDQALAADPQDITALRNQAYLYERQGEYEAAVRQYDSAIAAAPGRFDLYIERGRQLRVGLFDYEAANESYRQAVEVYESSITLDALGFGLYNVGDHLQAVRVLRQAVELDPDYGPALVHLGMALYARRNYEDAVPALEKGIEQLGDGARIEHIYTLGLAHIYKQPEECEIAIIWLLKALEIDPESLPALEGMALCT